MTSQIVDQDGYTSDNDFNSAVALSKDFKDGEILPGMKKRLRNTSTQKISL